MSGRFTWLGGRANARDDAASVKRAHAHRRHAGRSSRDAEKWEQRDLARYGRNPWYRRK